jgi:hypothetical protein
MMMTVYRCAAAFFIVAGLAVAGGAEGHEWFPLFATQVALGGVLGFTGYLFLMLAEVDEEDVQDDY